jgi:hypothetical protein
VDIEEEVQSLVKLEVKLRDDYLNRLVDFLKWTTTIALAAGLWIGTNLPNYLESSKLLQLSLFVISFGCEIISILVAVLMIYTIIGLWDLELKYIGHIRPVIDFFYQNRNESITDLKLSKQIKEIKAFHFSLPHIEKINKNFKIHVFFLILGILCFFAAILSQ